MSSTITLRPRKNVVNSVNYYKSIKSNKSNESKTNNNKTGKRNRRAVTLDERPLKPNANLFATVATSSTSCKQLPASASNPSTSSILKNIAAKRGKLQIDSDG